MEKQFVDYDNLKQYDTLIKEYIENKINELYDERNVTPIQDNNENLNNNPDSLIQL